MEASWVIRLLQADKSKTPILIKVTHKEGGHDIDLDLLATDGDAAFTGKVRQRSLKKLRAKNYDGSNDDWTQIVAHVLSPKTKPSIDATQKENLVVTGSIAGKDPNTTLSITFNNRVEDITQRLGTVELPQTEDTDDVNLFEWALRAIEERDDLEENVASLKGQVRSKGEVLATLQKQIDEVVEAKVEYETQMLSKFSTLLNEKKLKIRNMQRVLATAKTDPQKLKELETVIEGEPEATVGRRKKRPAGEDSGEGDEDESDGFEAMDVDTATNAEVNPDEDQSPETDQSTPEPSELDEADDDLDGPSPAPDRPRTRAMDAAREPIKQSPTPLPPRRELPFQKKAGQEGKQAAEENPEVVRAADEDDEETASEASEL